MDRESGRAHDAASVPRTHRNGSAGQDARLLAQSGASAPMMVDGGAPDTGVIGFLTERDIVRALATRGPDIYGHGVRVIAEPDVPAIDDTASPGDRMRAFCDRKVDPIALMDGFRIGTILNIRDRAGAAAAAAPRP